MKGRGGISTLDKSPDEHETICPNLEEMSDVGIVEFALWPSEAVREGPASLREPPHRNSAEILGLIKVPHRC